MPKLSLVLCLSLMGCVVTESGNPPLKPVITTDSVSGMTGLLLTEFTFAGSVMPAEGTVLVTNLDTEDEPVSSPVNDDGRYSLTIAGTVQDVFRMEVLGTETRSLPVDKEVILEGANYLLQDPAQQFASCLSIPTLVEVSMGESLIIKNACSEAISFDAPGVRVGSASLISEAFSVEAGGERMIDVTVATGESALLLLRTLGNRDRRAVTVH